MREPIVDEKTQKEMMAYYYKKQEVEKVRLVGVLSFGLYKAY
jgi:hypothetical protein